MGKPSQYSYIERHGWYETCHFTDTVALVIAAGCARAIRKSVFEVVL